MNNQRVARLRPFDIERTGKRVITFDERKGITGLLQRVAETIERVRVENVAGFEPGNGRRDAEDVFYIVDSGVIRDDF